MIAEISSAKTIAKPAAEPTFTTSSTGSSATMPKATAAARGQHADQVPAARPDHGDRRLQRVGVDDGRDGVGRVVKTVDEFEAERQAESDDEENRASNSQSAAE